MVLVSTEDNKALVTCFLKAFSTSPAEAVEEYLDEAGTWWVSGTLPVSGTHAKPELVAMLKPLLGAFAAGPIVTIQEMTAEGERVAVEAESRGTLQDGRAYHNTYHFLFVVRDGNLYEVKEYGDTHHAWELFFAG